MTEKELLLLKALSCTGELYNEMRELGVYDKFSGLYPFSTENIYGYLSQMDICDKDVLTVGASGDHVLNMITMGAKNIDYFDINPFAEKYLKLKIAAIKALTKEEFLEYFCYVRYPSTFENNKNAMNIKIYWKISKALDEDTRYFWDNLYLENNGIDIRTSSLFDRDEEKFSILEQTNSYLMGNKYYELRELLNNSDLKMKFHNCNIKRLHRSLTKKYDYIFLSNIAQYLKNVYQKDELTYFKNIILKLDNFLNDDGQIMLSYLYEYSDLYEYYSACSAIYDKKQRNKTFEKDDTTYFYFPSITDLKYKYQVKVRDAAFMYKKKKEL